jgi:hypothetical protein
MSFPVEEYLVKIGADIDTQSMNSANQALAQLQGLINKIGAAAPFVAAAGGIAGLTKATVGLIKSVADAQMGYMKLGKDMWITADSAKGLKLAMDTMNASADDIAWIPELREQFFRLRQEMQEFSTPSDANAQLKYIREIGYDIQALFMRLKMLKEWIVYYLIKYLAGPIAEFKKFIAWLSDKLGKNMPNIAQKIAQGLAQVVRFVYLLAKAAKSFIGGVVGFIDGLPDKVKKWGAIFAAVGVLIMASPFGRMLMAITAVIILVEDFLYYLNGWNSSKTLAPIWQKLIDIGNGSGDKWLGYVKDWMDNIATTLETIFKGLDIDKTLGEWKKGIGELISGVEKLITSLLKLVATMTGNESKMTGVWDAVGKHIGFALRTLARMTGLIGNLFAAVAMAMDGNFKAAGGMVLDAIKEFGKGQYDDFTGSFGPGISGSGDTSSNMPWGGKKETVTSGFGARTNPVTGEYQVTHDGIDIGIEEGTPVPSMMTGKVTYANWVKGYGNYVEVLDKDGYTSFYGHLSEIDVKEGQDVQRGQYIGKVGSTGRSTGPHLHWGLHDPSGNPVDPRTYNYDKASPVRSPHEPKPVSGDDAPDALASGVGGGGTVPGSTLMGNSFAGGGIGNTFAGGVAAGMAFMPTGDTNYGGFSMGDINISVGGTNASPQDIAGAVGGEIGRLVQRLGVRNSTGIIMS